MRSFLAALCWITAACAQCACAADDPSLRGQFVEVAAAAHLLYDQATPGTPPELPDARSASGGAAVGDFDGDGWPDLYVTRVDDSDILFRNLGDGTFTDQTAEAGLSESGASNGAAWGDIDNDGDLDLYVSVIDATRHLLFINDGSGHFTEDGVARNAVIANDQPHTGWSVSFGDYDRDGWLDIHLPERQDFAAPIAPSPSHVRLLRNLGASAPGHFEDVTQAAGVSYDGYPSPGARAHVFVSTFADMDDDGWPELLVTSDYHTSRLFWNNRDGTFLDGTIAAGVGTERDGMGSAVGDYDGDGRLDWFVDAISCSGCGRPEWPRSAGNRLYRNLGDRTFADVTDDAGVRDGWWGWGTAFFDYDNDGDLDIVQTNGVAYRDGYYAPFHRDPLRLWENRGDGTMRERSAELGLSDDGDGKGLMVFDYDDDGDLDILIVHHAGPPGLWRNDVGNQNAWCRVRLVGARDNSHGIGARVYFRADADGPEQVQEIRASGQYLGQSESVAHFGMGPVIRAAHRIRIRWPTTGLEQVLDDVECNRTIVIDEAP